MQITYTFLLVYGSVQAGYNHCGKRIEAVGRWNLPLPAERHRNTHPAGIIFGVSSTAEPGIAPRHDGDGRAAMRKDC